MSQPDHVASSAVRLARASSAAFAVLLAAQSAEAAPCTLRVAPETVAAARAVDGDTVALQDGREVRLAGITAPKPPLGTVSKVWPMDAEAKSLLDDKVVGRMLSFRAAGDPDRHGRLVGYLAEPGEADHAGVAVWLLQRGFARAAADRAGRDCGATLLAAEAPARRERLGLWAHPYYEVRDAVDGSRLGSDAGRFEIVEGRVDSVRTLAGRTYVNFGRRWRDALALTMSGTALKRLGGLAALRIERGARLRVRGVVEQRLGPTIAIEESAQIERIGGGR